MKNVEDILGLTSIQAGMLFHYLEAPHGDHYFEQLCLEISGEIDPAIFAKAWNVVIEANEMLRTVFRWEKLEKPSQIILKEHECKVIFYDLSDKNGSRKKTALEEIKKKDRHETFDLQQVPFRVNLCKLDGKLYEVIISNHHILYDGWSNGIILKEFFKAYHELYRGGQPVKLPVKPPFKEFIKWIQSQDKHKQSQYWREYLTGFETPTALPLRRRIDETAKAEDHSIILEKNLISKLDFFVKNNRVTLASIFYTAWGILLQKYCDSDDVVFGTTVSGRSARIKGIEDMVGLFINTIPLRIQAAPGAKLSDIVSGVEKVLQLREEFESTPLPGIRNYSMVGGTESLFDTIVAIENYPLDSRLLPEGSLLSVNSYSMVEMTHYDLTVGIVLFSEIEIKFSYNRRFFDKETIENLAGHFKGIVQNIVENPEAVLSQLEIISTEEKNRILYEFNNTAAEYPADKTIHRLFEEQVERTPDHIAVFGRGRTRTNRGDRIPMAVTYCELNEQSNRLAHLLIEKGILADTIVGIMAERSIEMVIGIYGILKAGGAYLPIDPEYPGERIDYILKDCAAELLVTTCNLTGEGGNPGSWEGEIFCTDELSRSAYPHTSLLPYLQNSSNLAYLIYTSGSTGKPKGVMVEHGSIFNTIYWRRQEYNFSAEDRALQLFSFAFDGFLTSFFTPSVSGASVVLLSGDDAKDVSRIKEIIAAEKITHFICVPSLYRWLLEITTGKELSCLKVVTLAGEQVHPDLVGKSKQLYPSLEVVNEYGPTESSVLASICRDVQPGAAISIGKPIANIGIYIIDKGGNLAPVGIPGQLAISGKGLARGYLNRPEMTAKKFVPLPRDPGLPRLYKTGDLSRRLPDGNIEFLGRIDQQVKIRGFRIEPGEIENRLLTHPGIKEAVVAARDEDHGHKYLCAYIVADSPFDTLELREYLSKELPAYMIPSYFMHLDHLPLNRNGKVDRKALPEPGKERSLSGISGRTYVAPHSDVEKMVADIWKQILKIDSVGVHDNFFDLGGNSLTIIGLSSKLKEAFKTEIPVATLFNYPTISAQANHLSGDEAENRGSEILSAGVSLDPDIAVIGMTGRFPGARNIDEFWNNIRDGVESITFFTDEELETMGVEAELIKNPNYVKVKGVLENIEYFDPVFFDYSTREAELMDPQLRIMHECVYEALEDAGYASGDHRGSIGLYAGSFSNSLWMRQLSDEITTHSGLLAVESLNDRDYLSTRISYKLNLKGPALLIQTACSTSLVAIDTACQALLSGKCRTALAGGITITLQDQAGYLHEDGMVRSPDGHCRPFDARAKGTVGGNGVGVVVLKRLADAIEDGDNIRAVIKGSATNNDGSRKVGYTAPSIEGQAEAIRAARAAAGIDPETITYIETHGTGTALGDPVEIEALKQAFGTGKKHYCRLGTLKANIGHLDAAAGVAGFIKTVLALEHRELPPAVNFKTPNPQIDFENSPFYIDSKPGKWKNNDHPLRAGVSSFGIGGTNAHVILEEAPQINPSSGGRDKKLILLSAKSKGALDRNTFNLALYLTQKPGVNLADAAYTLQVGRKTFNHRRVVVGADAAEVVKALSNPVGNPAVSTSTCDDSSKHVIFMFSGQGSQYVNMGLELYRTEPVFREEMDRCFLILKSIDDSDFKRVLYPGEDETAVETTVETSAIDQTEIAQPLLFVFEYALAKLLISWGIKPHSMIGHSIGEYTAACLAGVFSLEDSLKLVVWRGKLMQEMPGGSMLSVPLPVEELEPRLKSMDNLSLAAVNSSSLCVVSGPGEAVDAFAAILKEDRIASTRLHTSHAFHSQMMDPMLGPFEEKVKTVTLNPPHLPYISNAAGFWITVEQAVSPRYWVDHVRGTVHFNEGLIELMKDPKAVLVEVGPGRALSTFARKHKDRGDHQPVLHLVRHPGDKIADDYFLLQQIGQLWLSGVTVRWEEFYRDEKRRRVPLPTYSFDHRYYWKYGQKIRHTFAAVGKEETLPDTAPRETKDKKPNSRKPIDGWFYIPQWKSSPRISVSHPGGGAVGKWVVFSDESDFGKSLVNRMKQGGAEISIVKAGSGFARLADSVYTLNPGKPGDYIDLFKTLAIENKIPRKILHLWNTRLEDANYAGIDRVLEKGFYSLIYLAQAVGKQDITGELSVIVISSNMQAVTDNEAGSPLHSTLLGACNVIPKEYPNILVRSIDIALPESRSREEQKLLDLLMREWSEEDKEKEETVEPAAAYRNNVRWVPTFNPVVLSSPRGLSKRLREKGVYLITGGMGGMGSVLAGYLAKSVRARLILTDLSNFPGPGEWDRWAAEHGEQDDVTRKIRRLRELEAQGAEIVVVQADAADYTRMKTVISDIIRRFGTLNGIIHTAGLPDGGIIQTKTRETMDAVMAPKIKGTMVLDALLSEASGEIAPDFVIFCSSLTSRLGAFGQVAYTAANIFLDSFARYKNSGPGASTLFTSIDWDRWEEVGMAVKAEDEFQKVRLEHPLFLDRIVKDDGKIIYNSRFSVKTMWMLDEHRIMGKAVLPGTAYLEMARAAFELQTGRTPVEIKEIFFLEPLSVDDNEEREVRTVLEMQGDNFVFSISNRGTGVDSKWSLNATGKLAHMEQPVSMGAINVPDTDGMQAEGESPANDMNPGLMTFGPRFANISSVKYGKNMGLAVLELDDTFLDDLTRYKLHPALLDRTISILDSRVKEPGDGNYIPFSYKGVKILRPLPQKITGVVRYIESRLPQKEALEFDVRILDESGGACVEIESFVMKRVNNELPVSWDGNVKDGEVDEMRDVRLDIAEPGNLDSFRFLEIPRVKPGPGEVEIEVCAAGLNFKEVLYALGMLPLPPGRQFTFGLECSGRITSCGEGVEEFAVGDEVIAFANSAFSRYVVVPASSAARKPVHLDFEESAAVPVAFMTAYYSLVTLGRLKKGERVLIHSAAGGVGLAAVKIAQWVGAEIFATAGNPVKREYLSSLGIRYVMDSRSGDFAGKIMEITGGKGVDVLLNSLSGEAILKGISILAPHGRFLELGIKDIAENTALGMRAFEKSISFSAVSIEPGIPGFTSIFREIVHHLNERHFDSLPYRAYPIRQAAEAFKYMAQAKHIGKVIVSRPDRPGIVGKGILPAEGLDVFARVLNREDLPAGPGLSNVLVSTSDFNSRVRESRKNSMPGDGAVSGAVKSSAHTGSRNPRPSLSTDYAPPLSEMEKQLVDVWQDFLGLDTVGVHDNFFELGASSLDIIQVNQKLNTLLGKEMSVVTFYTYPTVHTLAASLNGEKTGVDASQKKEKVSQDLSRSQKTLKGTINKMKGMKR